MIYITQNFLCIHLLKIHSNFDRLLTQPYNLRHFEISSATVGEGGGEFSVPAPENKVIVC